MIETIKLKVPFSHPSEIHAFLTEGDVIAVTREKFGIPLYDHYGIYTGDGRIIHFAKESGDIFGEDPAIVHEIDVEAFVGASTAVYVVRYPDKEKAASNVLETAKSLVGSTGYHLAFNNCEHFAVFCKTGIHISTQTINAIREITKIIIRKKSHLPANTNP